MTGFGPHLEVIKPAPFNDRAFDEKIIRALNRTADLISRDYERTVATWDEQPEFKQKFTINADEISVSVFTTDNVYRFLHDGTRVRYAVMSKGFRPKTRVNRLTSGAGRGGRTHIDVIHPRPGIQARNWTQRIVKVREKQILRLFTNAIKGAIHESKHAR